MKKILIAGTAFALLCGVASAQENLGASKNPNVTPNGGMTNTERSNGTSNRLDNSTHGTVGSSGTTTSPARAQPGGLAGSGGPNAGNQGGAAPGASAGGGNGR